MVTLIIMVGVYIIECIGTSCYSISRGSFEAMFALGLLEIVYEIPNLIRIYRKKEIKEKILDEADKRK